MIKTIALCLLIAALFACPIVQNNKPLIDQKPTLLKSVTNGQKLLIGDPSKADGDYLYIANLKGTPLEMGKAFGELYADQIKDNLKLFYAYYMDALQEILEKKIPKFLARRIDATGLELLKKVLDLNVIITEQYTNARYYQEIKGVSEGAKIPEKDIKRLNMFPELIKAACTVAGVWKNATKRGQTLHVRSLDWDYKNPISKYPVLNVYHPSDPKLQTHANFAWAGFIGSMTGMSQKVSIGEKVWLPPKGTVQMTRYGNPWTYVFRDVLYEATNMETALALLSNTHRTCAIHIGVASASDHSFRMFEYSQKVLNNYDDQNYTHYAANHPKTPGVAYFDKHVQPSGDNCLGQLLTNANLYGKWQAQSLFRYIGLTHETGDTQLAVFDLENQIAYVSYSSSDGKTKAFERSPIYLNMGELFTQPF